MHIPIRLSVDIFMLALGAALSYWIGAKNGQQSRKQSDARSGDNGGCGGMSEKDKKLNRALMRENDALKKRGSASRRITRGLEQCMHDLGLDCTNL
ncbi:hypothetical protein TsFJ059_008989 [Trichoderma semiorbis]|uniref:Uncharacterized protein n=1 Tax=Trichoderma semiorbis TaxID=1491008 RepID=A0A9P8HM69_9HYPO|nr:hypothetical protein TsFJ059_008989 [Trichoderma semiorbis]